MYDSATDPRVLARGGRERLLVATGEPETAELLCATLELAGYRIARAVTGAEIARRLTEQRFPLVVLDAELPGVEELGSRLAVAYRPAVLLLTACDSLARLLPQLGTVQRDYVTKPVRIAEVLARIQVLLRANARNPANPDNPRSASGGDGGSWGSAHGAPRYADLVLDDTTCRARRGRRVLDLTPAEYRLLRHLLVSAHKVLSKEQISRYVWGEFRGDNAIEQLVSRLRRKVDRDGPALIHTRRGFGYWLGGPG
ncbi:response regulator transcription factor [Streptomyces sp. NPDC006739]|uniref:response regulator transcription factor n=1 Tax=Streptomyces sp. NPDC006739 TaxID=3364763 RepID=UPI003681106F